MGQAKQRGTFEQRQAESIQREAERQVRERAAAEDRKRQQRLHDLAYPKEAAARRARSYRTATMLSLALGAAVVMSAAPTKSEA